MKISVRKEEKISSILLGLAFLVALTSDFSGGDNGKILSSIAWTIIFVGTLVLIGYSLWIKNNEKRADFDKRKFSGKQSYSYKHNYKKHKQKEHTYKNFENISKELNYYEIFGVSRNASFDEIKSRYKQLCLKVHPDKEKSALFTDSMKKINEAYEILSDTRKREEYDHGLV